MSYLQLNDAHIRGMKELRANGWSVEGIAHVFRRHGVTEASVEWLIGERTLSCWMCKLNLPHAIPGQCGP